MVHNFAPRFSIKMRSEAAIQTVPRYSSGGGGGGRMPSEVRIAFLLSRSATISSSSSGQVSRPRRTASSSV